MSIKSLLQSLNPIEVVKDGINSIGNLIDNLSTTDEERNAAKVELSKIENQVTGKLIDLEVKLVEAKERIMVAELNQSDTYTKRARPTIIYGGLLILFINHVVLPWVAFFQKSLENVPAINLPTEFWIAWGGVVSVYAYGRTKEKITPKITEALKQ